MADGVALIPFCGGSYQYKDRNVSPQRTINFYPERVETEDGRVKWTLRPTEGEEKVYGRTENEPFEGVCRGLWWSSTSNGGRSCLYGVWGKTFWRIWRDDAGVMHTFAIGNVGGDSGPCTICDNGFLVLVADGTNLWGTSLTDENSVARAKWTDIELPNLGDDGAAVIKPAFVAYIAQRFVINNTNIKSSARGVFVFSNEAVEDLSALSFSVLGTNPPEPQYYSAEQNADALLSIIVNEGRLYLFGERSYEVWAPNDGADAFDPFSFIGGSQSQIGIQAPYSAASIQRLVFWLGGSHGGRNMVFVATGAEAPVRVSTNAIEDIIAKKRVRSAAYAFCYARDGHIFYVLTFPNDGATLVYDYTTEQWHERDSHDWNTGDEIPWHMRFASVAFDQQIWFGSTGDEEGNSWLCRLREDKGTDIDGNPIVRKRISPVVWDSEKRVVIRDFVIDAEVGTTEYLNEVVDAAIIADMVQSSDTNPTAQLRVSRDGGITWKDCPWRKFGRTGQYRKMLRWKNLGMGRYISLELTITEKTPIVIAAARISAEASLL